MISQSWQKLFNICQDSYWHFKVMPDLAFAQFLSKNTLHPTPILHTLVLLGFILFCQHAMVLSALGIFLKLLSQTGNSSQPHLTSPTNLLAFIYNSNIQGYMPCASQTGPPLSNPRYSSFYSIFEALLVCSHTSLRLIILLNTQIPPKG